MSASLNVHLKLQPKKYANSMQTTTRAKYTYKKKESHSRETLFFSAPSVSGRTRPLGLPEFSGHATKDPLINSAGAEL
jgi:hypothetical protein